MPREVRGKRIVQGAKDPMFERLERQMDDIVGRLFNRPVVAAYRRAWAPRIDVYDTEDAYVAVVELAGVDPGSVLVEIEGESVAITGQRTPTTPPGCADYLQLEIPFGEFERTLLLPTIVEADEAAAKFEDGILTLRLPKARRGPKRVQVDVQRPE